MKRLIQAVLLMLLAFTGQELFAQRGGGGTTNPFVGNPVLTCVGTPGNTAGKYLSICVASNGAAYSCTNSGGCTTAIQWVSTAVGAMVYPGAGVANSTGSAWGTSYTTSGSGAVLALSVSPTFVTPTLGVAAATVLNVSGSNTVLSGTAGTATCYQALQGTLKISTCYLAGYQQTSTAQTWSFPTAFSFIPVLQISSNSCGTYNPTATASVLTLPANAAMSAESCNVIAIGQ